MKRPLIALSICISLLSLSCADSGVGPSGGTTGIFGPIPTTVNTMNITVDGVSYSFIAFGFKMATTPSDTGVIAAGADISGRGGGIGFSGIHKSGTYDIGPAKLVAGVPTFVIMTYQYVVAATHDSVQYAIQGSYTDTTSFGKLKIVELTSTSLKASFYGKLAKQKGISGADTITVTNGGIYVQLN